MNKTMTCIGEDEKMHKNKNITQNQKTTNVITSIKTKMKMKTKVYLVKNVLMKTMITWLNVVNVKN